MKCVYSTFNKNDEYNDTVTSAHRSNNKIYVVSRKNKKWTVNKYGPISITVGTEKIHSNLRFTTLLKI